MIMSHIWVLTRSPILISPKSPQEFDVWVKEFLKKTNWLRYRLSFRRRLIFQYEEERDGIRNLNKALPCGRWLSGELWSKVVDEVHELTWEDLFMDLKKRGLTHSSRVGLAISNGYVGIEKAVEKSFLGSTAGKMCSCPFHQSCIEKKFPRNTGVRSPIA